MKLADRIARGRLNADHPIRRRSIEEILAITNSNRETPQVKFSDEGKERMFKSLKISNRLRINDENKRILFGILYDMAATYGIEERQISIGNSVCRIIEDYTVLLEEICLDIEDPATNNHAIQFVVYSAERYLNQDDPIRIKKTLAELDEARRSAVRDFIEYTAKHNYKLTTESEVGEKIFVDDESGVAATSKITTKKKLSPLETLIFYLADQKEEEKRRLPTKKSQETVFKALTTYYIGDNFDLLETYVDVLEEDYEDRGIAVECLELFLEKEYERSRRAYEDYKQGAYTDPAITDLGRPDKEDLKKLSKLLKTQPNHKGFYELIKSIIIGNTRMEEIEAQLTRLKIDPNMREDYYRYLARAWNNRRERETAIEIIAKGEIRDATELEECTELDIPNYSPISRIGQGQTRKVFKVERESTEQILALKIDIPERDILHPRARDVIKIHSQDELSKRERTALMDLTHPHLARMWDFGTCRNHPYQGRSYIVEDYVEGTTLEDLVKKRVKPLGVGDLIPIFGPIGRALKYLMENYYVHRDIKPDNILVSPDFRIVKLTDLQNAVRLNNSGEYIGKSYGSYRTMAPELILESSASFLTDLYSMGICMYYALVGEMPYDFKYDGTEEDKRKIKVITNRSKIKRKTFKRISRYFKPGTNIKQSTDLDLTDEAKTHLKLYPPIIDASTVIKTIYNLIINLTSLTPMERTDTSLDHLEFFYSRYLLKNPPVLNPT